MAVNGITGINSILIQTPENRQGTAPQSATRQNDNAAPDTPEPAPEQRAIQQNSNLIEETLRTLDFTGPRPDDASLFNTQSPFLAILQATQEFNEFQQTALQLNETLQNLNFVPPEQTNPLLTNELLPALEGAEITSNFDLTQQNDQFINETLQNLNPEAPVKEKLRTSDTVNQKTFPAEETAATQTSTTPQNVNIPSAETETGATPVTGAATKETTVSPPTPAAESAVLTIPIAANFQTPIYTPATLPLTLYPDRTPYVLAVFQPNDPAPQPGAPKPIDKEVPPTAPVVKTRPVGDSRYRQALQGSRVEGLVGNASGYDTTRTTMAQVEKSIHLAISQANTDLNAHGSDLHLVFAKHENGFALDVYDCSYNEACRLSYDIAISLDNLGSVLGNLQHGTGVIVDTTS